MNGIIAGMLAFAVNFLLLMSTSRWQKADISIVRMLLAALFGGVSVAACFLPGFHFLGKSVWRAIFMALTGLAAFWHHKKLFRLTVLFFLMELMLQLIALGISKGGVWAAGVCFVSMLLLRLVDGQPKSRRFASVQITHADRSVDLTALVDTGNNLRDPISGHSVLVVDENVAYRLLNLSSESLQTPLQTLVSTAIPGLRLIPYHSVGNPNGMMLGIQAEKVIIDGVRCERVVAFAPHSFGNGKMYEALAGGTV